MSDQAAPSKRDRINLKEWLVFAIVLALMVLVLAADLETTPDHVTICFIYAAIIFLSIFSFHRSAYIAAAVATLFSILGSFINPPAEAVSVVFFRQPWRSRSSRNGLSRYWWQPGRMRRR